MNGHMGKLALILLAVLSTAHVHGKDPAPLSHNPFVRPPSTVTIDRRPSLAADGSIQVINLQATMVVSNKGLANVGGQILRPGDEIDGYTLLRVFEDRAIFSRNGKRLTVFVKPEMEADDD